MRCDDRRSWGSAAVAAALLFGCSGQSSPSGAASSDHPAVPKTDARGAAPAPAATGFGPARQLALQGANLCVLSPGGDVKCVGEWPLNTETATSSGSRNQYIQEPLQVMALSAANNVTIANDRGCAVLDDGSVTCWGNTHATRNGWSGAVAGTLEAVAVADLSDIAQVALAWNGSCALEKDGHVSCWGPGFTTASRQSDAVDPPRRLAIEHAQQISAGRDQACVVLGDGSVVCWGDDPKVTPGRVGGLSDAIEVAVGSTHSCARTRDGKVACWGDNSSGQLGNGTTTASQVPVEVAGVVDAIQVVTSGSSPLSCALSSEGEVSCWGENSNCSLGDQRPSPCEKHVRQSSFGTSETEYCTTPQQIAMPFVPVQIDVGASTGCARDAKGAVACWGRSLLGGATSCSAVLIP